MWNFRQQRKKGVRSVWKKKSSVPDLPEYLSSIFDLTCPIYLPHRIIPLPYSYPVLCSTIVMMLMNNTIQKVKSLFITQNVLRPFSFFLALNKPIFMRVHIFCPFFLFICSNCCFFSLRMSIARCSYPHYTLLL